jgi:hypothetical protein
MTAVDPVRRHLADAGELGRETLAAVDDAGAALSWGLLAFSPAVACLRVRLALGARSQAVVPAAFPDALLPQGGRP